MKIELTTLLIGSFFTGVEVIHANFLFELAAGVRVLLFIPLGGVGGGAIFQNCNYQSTDRNNSDIV